MPWHAPMKAGFVPIDGDEFRASKTTNVNARRAAVGGTSGPAQRTSFGEVITWARAKSSRSNAEAAKAAKEYLIKLGFVDHLRARARRSRVDARRASPETLPCSRDNARAGPVRARPGRRDHPSKSSRRLPAPGRGLPAAHRQDSSDPP